VNGCACWSVLASTPQKNPNHCADCHNVTKFNHFKNYAKKVSGGDSGESNGNSGTTGAKSGGGTKNNAVSLPLAPTTSIPLGLDTHSQNCLVHPTVANHVLINIIKSRVPLVGVSGVKNTVVTELEGNFRCLFPPTFKALVVPTLPVAGVISEVELVKHGYTLQYHGRNLIAKHLSYPNLFFSRHVTTGILTLDFPLNSRDIDSNRALVCVPGLDSPGFDSRVFVPSVSRVSLGVSGGAMSSRVGASGGLRVSSHVKMENNISLSSHTPPPTPTAQVGIPPLSSHSWLTPNLEQAFHAHMATRRSFDQIRRNIKHFPGLKPISAHDVSLLKTITDPSSTINAKPVASIAPSRPVPSIGSEFFADLVVWKHRQTVVVVESRTKRASVVELPSKESTDVVAGISHVITEYRQLGYHPRHIRFDPERANTATRTLLASRGIQVVFANANSHEVNAERVIKELEKHLVSCYYEGERRLGRPIPSFFHPRVLASCVSAYNNTPNKLCIDLSESDSSLTNCSTPDSIIKRSPVQPLRITQHIGDIVLYHLPMVKRSSLVPPAQLGLVVGLDFHLHRATVLNVDSRALIERAPEALTVIYPSSLSIHRYKKLTDQLLFPPPPPVKPVEKQGVNLVPEKQGVEISHDDSKTHNNNNNSSTTESILETLPPPSQSDLVEGYSLRQRAPRVGWDVKLQQQSARLSSYPNLPTIALPALTPSQARAHPQYDVSLEKEAQMMHQRGVFTPTKWIDLSQKQIDSAVRSHVVFASKPNNPIKIKSRLVASDSKSSPDQSNFAGTPTITASFLTLAMAVENGHEISLLDFDSAFLFADIPPNKVGQVTIVPPYFSRSMYRVSGQQEWLRYGDRASTPALTHKALYGYRFSPKQWIDFRNKALSQAGLVANPGEANLFHLRPRDAGEDSSSVGNIISFSDDLLCTQIPGTRPLSKVLDPILKSTFNNEIKIKVLKYGKPQTFLGFDLEYLDSAHTALRISQSPLIDEILEMYLWSPNASRASTSTPSSPEYLNPSPEILGERLTGTPLEQFASMVAKIGYLHTVPSVKLAHHLLACRSSSPCMLDWKMLDKCITYLDRHGRGGIIFRKRNIIPKSPPQILVWADASLASRPNSLSQSGICVMLDDIGTLVATSRRQTRFASSAQQAESNALQEASNYGLWIQQMLAGFVGRSALHRIVCLQDNEASVKLTTTNNISTSAANRKYNDLAVDANRFLNNIGEIRLAKVSSEQMIAGALTKPVPSTSHTLAFGPMADTSLLSNSTRYLIGSAVPRGCVRDSPIIPFMGSIYMNSNG
jgi:hypothetical protein